MTSYKDAPTRTVSAGGVDFAYRELGPKAGVPVIFLVHLAGNLDNWDPRVVDGVAAKRRVITFDNRGVGASTGKTPDTIQAMADGTVLLGGVAESGSCAIGETVSAKQVDEYLRGLEEPKRSTLEVLRRTILDVVPDADQVISYRVPAFRVGGKTVAGFAALRNHLSYLPFSGSVLSQLADELAGYTMTRSALHFPVDHPLSKELVERLIAVRLAEAGRGSR